MLLRELPYRDGDRLVQVGEMSASLGRDVGAVSPANYLAWRERVSALKQELERGAPSATSGPSSSPSPTRTAFRDPGNRFRVVQSSR